jgi:hypothetical protein
VELADDARFAVFHMPDKRTRVSFSREDFDSLVTGVVDDELLGLDANCVESERFQTDIASSEVNSISVFADHKGSLAFIVELCRTARSSSVAQP